MKTPLKIPYLPQGKWVKQPLMALILLYMKSSFLMQFPQPCLDAVQSDGQPTGTPTVFQIKEPTCVDNVH
nr:hypothetical protein BaRGS_006246 [Batillaria attramentaria]